jgi:hypothetical protein
MRWLRVAAAKLDPALTLESPKNHPASVVTRQGGTAAEEDYSGEKSGRTGDSAQSVIPNEVRNRTALPVGFPS